MKDVLNATDEHGFTVIELMVTVFVAAMFLVGLVTLTTTYNYFMAIARQTSVADNLAYTYAQKYARPDYTSSSWFVCNSNSNLIANPTGNGYAVVPTTTLSADAVGLPGPVTYSVTAYAPYGCVGDDASKPVKVDAAVTYGAASRVIHHVVYTKGAL